MAITIKNEHEIALMRESGRLLALVHEEMRKELKEGMTTKDIDQICETMIRDFGCIPNFLNYQGFPASVCVSINDEVVHGIPSKKRYIQNGDIVSLDAGLIYKGYHSDAARTHGVGEISPEAQRIIDVTRQSFFEGIKFAKPGNHLVDIARGVQTYAESFLLIMRIRLRLLMMDARFLRCCQKRKRHLEYYKNDTAMNNKQKEK